MSRARDLVLRAVSAWVLAFLSTGCPRAAEQRALDDLEVGVAEVGGVRIVAADGLAHPRSVSAEAILWWSSAPVVALALEVGATSTLEQRWTFANCMPGSLLEVTSGDGVVVSARATGVATRCEFAMTLAPGARASLVLAPPDHARVEAFRFAVMGDIQTALDRVDELFQVISDEPGVRFVLSTGDVVETAAESEYELFEQQLDALSVPFYSTIGNHELWESPERWRRRFGRCSLHFTFKGMVASFVDSGNAGIDPVIYEWLEAWLAEGAGRLHIFGTHFPPIDPVGARSAAFRSRREAAKLLSRLAAGGVDATFYGHVHTFAAFENANIPAYISGGGGAWPERLDGVGRHFLVVDAEPQRDRLASVRVVEID